jgi:hypothetical protein
MLDIKCPMCQTVYHSDEANIGRSLRCSICGSAVPILRDARTIVQSPPRSVRLNPNAGIRNSKLRRPRVVSATTIFVSLAVAGALVLHIRKPSASRPAERNEASAPTVPAPPPGFTLDQDNSVSTAPSGIGTPGKTDPTVSQPMTFSADEVEEASGTGTAKVGPIRPQPRSVPRPSIYNSLPSGSSIESDECAGGHGVLTVQNGTSEDAVVRLYDLHDERTICWFFVGQNDSASTGHIPEGDYGLTYTMGLDWIESEDAFRWQPSYGEYERAFRYTEQRNSEGLQYKEISVTLQPVHGGNVKTRSISRADFLRGHRHIALQR